MSFLGEIGSKFHIGEIAKHKPESKTQEQKAPLKTSDDESSYTSKGANEAVMNNAQASINAQKSEVKTCPTANMIGKLFPDFDQKEITQDYIKLREEARKKSLDTTRKLYKAFTTGDLSDVKDKDGNIIATFSTPKNGENKDVKDAEFYSYKMTEYDPKTKEIIATTKVFNHSNFNKHWKALYAPYIERIEYGKNPEDTTFLKITLSSREQNGKYILSPTFQTYAKGYQTDGIVTGKRKADKFISKLLHQDYESYRTNYEAPAGIFDGCLYAESASVTEKGGMEGEKFDSALEYPIRQLEINNSLYVFNPYYVNEEGNRTKE